MTSVREATFDLFRAHGMTTIFGNPGSTELPMLADFPDDFTYVLGLQELVVMGMADGFAQASGRPTHVNLHTAPGVGNAVGGIFNAQANKSPLVITAGQQVRPQITIEANLTNRDATVGPQPYVKWSHEPPRAQDVPGAIARAIHHAMLPPKGPAFVSIPMDDWNVEADADRASAAIARRVIGRMAPDEAALARSGRAPGRRAARRCWSPAPTSTPPAAGTPPSPWPRSSACRCGPAPPPAAPGSASPSAIRTSSACCRRRSGAVSETLKAHDLVLVVGSSVFPYYPYIPGPLLGETTQLVAHHQRSRRGRPGADGRGHRRRRGAGAGAAGRAGARGTRDAPEPRPEPGDPPAADPPDRLSGSEAMAALADAFGDDAIVVLESPSCTLSLRNRLRISTPGSYYFCASGGLGFGIAAAVGVQLAQPARPVVCVLGEGSAQYGITALWSALAYKAPVTFLILRNDEYMILKWFAMLEQVTGAPGLDLPGLDVAAVARGYGVPAQDVSGREELDRGPARVDRRRRRAAGHPGPGRLRDVAGVRAVLR